MNEISSGELLFDQDKKSDKPLIFTMVLLAVVIVFFYFFSFIPIEGVSMENTIHDGQYGFVQRNNFSVKRGDIVLINTATSGKEHIIIKRVIGVAGDKIIFMATQDRKYVELYICKNGERSFSKLDEPYIKEQMLFRLNIYGDFQIMPYTQTIDEQSAVTHGYISEVPANSIFFLGDNRNESRDSRYYGFVDNGRITSKIIGII